MYRVLLAMAVVAALAGYSAAYPDTFSIDLTSPSAGAYDPAGIIAPGPLLHVTGSSLGLQAGDDLDALTSGFDTGTVIYFSVCRSSQGKALQVPWDTVHSEALAGQVPGDVFVTCTPNGVASMPMGYSMLYSSQRYFGLLPVIPAGQSYSGPLDNLNAFNFDEFDLAPTIISMGDLVPDRHTYFSLAAGSPSLTGALTADDILVYNPVSKITSVFADGALMGLVDGDDLDALVLSDRDDVAGQLFQHGVLDAGHDSALFSLAPGSPTLGIGGHSAADIFFTTFEGWFGVYATANSLGLLPTDNVDALEVQPGVVPEPGTMALLGVGLVGLAAYRRRR